MARIRTVRPGQERPREKWRRFIEWFNNVIMEAEIYDYRYPVKGCYVWRPYGMKIRRNVEKIIRKLLEDTGHEEVLFPVFIPQEFFAKEAEHFRNFEQEVFWVTKGLSGEERLILRPTSETAMYPMVKNWIYDHKDLPFKIYQIVNVFRAETKMTHPMIRLREISMFKEAHTFHADREDAERQIREAIEIYKKYFDELCVPYLLSMRPEWDKFPGAVYTIAFDTLMPDGKTLQIGTIHYLGTNFSKVFEVMYLRPDGKRDYVHITCYGISERSIAAMLAAHGDDRGLCIPPKIAPIQVVIIPIMYKEVKEKTREEAYKIKEELEKAEIRVVVDDREDKTPGWKYYYWELKGVPLRIEIGPRDIENRKVTIVRRDNFEKYEVDREELIDAVRELMEEVTKNLREQAWKNLIQHVKLATTIEEAAKLIQEGNIVEVPWCGSKECGLKLQEKTDADALGTPIDKDVNKEIQDLRDPICGQRANTLLRLSWRY
ncbi:MAG: proline--tRNA ligase [Crenarchaeota archaeon]|nr:proline--tRNA ligase [Thermoproteota archaeon]